LVQKVAIEVTQTHLSIAVTKHSILGTAEIQTSVKTQGWSVRVV
jgi:hypothetical protein